MQPHDIVKCSCTVTISANISKDQTTTDICNIQPISQYIISITLIVITIVLFCVHLATVTSSS